MKLLTVLAVAFAAGTIGFAANAQPRPQTSAAPVREPIFKTQSAKPDVAKDGKKANAKATERRNPKAKAEKRHANGKRVYRKKNRRQRVVIDTTTTATISTSVGYAQPAGARYDVFVSKHATSNGVPLDLAHAVISIESNYRVNARGSAGEIGLMQIKPATARMMGYRGNIKGLYDPETNIRYGMKYLGMAHKLGGGATCATILRYNAGHAARRMNPVSSAYCRKVQRELAS
jgi:soluble lytic murein transglycosylase-like protein